MIKATGVVLAVTLGLSVSDASASTIYEGITFPDGDVSFADRVVDYALGDGVDGAFLDPKNALGTPDYFAPGGDDSLGTGSFSLGTPGRTPNRLDDSLFGFITVQFTDNSLTTSGNSDADLFVFETGGAVEPYKVEISTNNLDWIFVGNVTGQPSSIDIDGVTGVNAGDRFSYVRVTDIPGTPNTGSPFSGPDIDAIGAISSAAPVNPVPLPAAGWMLLAALGGLIGLRRKT